MMCATGCKIIKRVLSSTDRDHRSVLHGFVLACVC